MDAIAQQAISRCYEILKTKPDPFGHLWREATGNERRIFLLIAGLPTGLTDRPWDQLRQEHQTQLRLCVGAMRDLLNRRLVK